MISVISESFDFEKILKADYPSCFKAMIRVKLSINTLKFEIFTGSRMIWIRTNFSLDTMMYWIVNVAIVVSNRNDLPFPSISCYIQCFRNKTQGKITNDTFMGIVILFPFISTSSASWSILNTIRISLLLSSESHDDTRWSVKLIVQVISQKHEKQFD